MQWKKERDLLVAQTRAFVQSVTGRKSDLEAGIARSGLETAPVEAVASDIWRIETRPIETRPVETRPVETRPVETKGFAAKATTAEAAKDLETSETVEPLRNVSISRTVALTEFQAEIQNRVAHFRPIRQRFDRERAQYFSEDPGEAPRRHQ